MGKTQPKDAKPALSQVSSDSRWNNADFTATLGRAQRNGPTALSNHELLHFCRGAYGYFAKHLWIDAQPFFVELWRRIERHQIRGIRTKEEACREIGCTVRWAQMIVAGTAKDSNKQKAKGMRRSCEVNSPREALTDEDYVDAIARYGNAKLEDLKARDWERFQRICELLQESFHEAARGYHDHERS